MEVKIDPMIDVIGLKWDAGLALRDCDIDSLPTVQRIK